MYLTPAQRLLVKRLKQAEPIGLPREIVHSLTLDGLVRRGLAETYDHARVVTTEMVRLVPSPDLDGEVA